MPAFKSLTTKEVARLCRVSDATVKRWEESGILKSERTAGGHRRFRTEEVARFQQDAGLGLKICHGDESVQTATTRRRSKKNQSSSSIFHSMISGRDEEVASFLLDAFLNKTPLSEIFDKLIAEAMREIGDLWFRGELTIAEEHLATRATMSALQKLRNAIPVSTPTGMLAMCCSIEGDFHELPTHLVQILLESSGWEVMNFGANMPIYSLTEEVLHHSPEMVILSANIMVDVERTSRDYKEFKSKIARTNPSVVIGGRAFKDEISRARFSCDFHAESFDALAEISEKLKNSTPTKYR